MERETRGGLPAETRAEGDAVRVEGYAAVFDEWASIGGWFEERIAPGAFSAALERGDDVVFLVDHEGLPLARTSSSTLDLAEDSKGLRMETSLDAVDPDVARIVPKMTRGDLSKMSFAFRATREEWDETGDLPRRTVLEVELFDVSIVTTPAFDGTSIAMRSLEASRAPRLASANIARRRRMELDLRARGLRNV